MALLEISEIIRRCSEFKKKEERVLALQANANEPIKIILQYMFHPDVKFLLPEGDPPYKPAEVFEASLLYKEARKLYIFIDGGNPNVNQIRREAFFLDILQAVTPEDAKLLIAMKDKKSPYKGLTKDVAFAAFPELFPT